jgi:hypothetical protein
MRNIYPNASPALRIALIYPAEVLARFSLEVEIHRTSEMERVSCVEAGCLGYSSRCEGAFVTFDEGALNEIADRFGTMIEGALSRRV